MNTPTDLPNSFAPVSVIGVALLPAGADKARAIYDQFYKGHFEDLDLAPLVGQFDAIIAADVLEHLFNPWVARAAHGPRPGGRP